MSNIQEILVLINEELKIGNTAALKIRLDAAIGVLNSLPDVFHDSAAIAAMKGVEEDA